MSETSSLKLFWFTVKYFFHLDTAARDLLHHICRDALGFRAGQGTPWRPNEPDPAPSSDRCGLRSDRRWQHTLSSPSIRPKVRYRVYRSSSAWVGCSQCPQPPLMIGRFRIRSSFAGFDIIEVAHDDDIGILGDHLQHVRQALFLGRRRSHHRVGFADHRAAQAVHGGFKAHARARAGLEEQGGHHIAGDQGHHRAVEGLQRQAPDRTARKSGHRSGHLPRVNFAHKIDFVDHRTNGFDFCFCHEKNLFS